MTEKEVKEYKAFMGNPENNGSSSWPGYTLPCGQQNCWVDCTCKGEEE